MASNSPWGVVQHVSKTNFRGISFIDTAGHGGMRVSKGVAEYHVPKKILAKEAIFYGNYYYFEEDCTWAIPCYFSTKIREAVNALFSKKSPEEFKHMVESHINRYFNYILG